MKSYELIIATQQPICGGKSPKNYDFSEIETDDPVEYVRQKEEGSDAEIESHVNPDGEIVVEVNDDERHIQYRFSEIK